MTIILPLSVLWHDINLLIDSLLYSFYMLINMRMNRNEPVLNPLPVSIFSSEFLKTLCICLEMSVDCI